MLVFVEVVRAGSFTGAARALGMPKSSVSRKVSNLEDRLGVQLLHRTTRTLRLTDVGEEYHGVCQIVVAEARAGEERVSEMRATPCGRLRVTVPPTFAFLGEIVAEYLGRHPDVRVDIVCTERTVDLVGEGFDVAIRAGRLADSSLVSRRLGSVFRFLVATPAYLDRRGAPRTPADLGQHDLLVFGGGDDTDVWPLRAKGRAVDLAPAPRLVVDDYGLLLEAACRGSGIALLPDYVCHGAIEDGALVRVLPRWASPGIPIHALFAPSRQPSIKLGAWLDLLGQRFSALLDRTR